jgi:hypothetical protein
LEWKNVLGEEELLKMLGVSKPALAKMRYAGLPCLYATARCRLYVDREVIEWAASHDKPAVGKKLQEPM